MSKKSGPHLYDPYTKKIAQDILDIIQNIKVNLLYIQEIFTDFLSIII